MSNLTLDSVPGKHYKTMVVETYYNINNGGYMTDFNEFNTGAQKDISEKLRLDLVPPEMIRGVARPLGYGVKKYAARNWEKGIPLMTSYAAAMRHLLQWASGVDVDEESGLLHIEQAMCNIGMIVTQTARHRHDLDDRPLQEPSGFVNKSDPDEKVYIK